MLFIQYNIRVDFNELNLSSTLPISTPPQPPYFVQLSGADLTGTSGVPESVSQHTAVSTLCRPHWPLQLLEVKAKGRFGALWMANCRGEHVAVKIFPASVSTD